MNPTKVKKYSNAPVAKSNLKELEVAMANSSNGQLLIKDFVKFNKF